MKKDLATLAVKALIYEVSASPKPGLVDRFNNGSHKDMDYYTFVDSAFSMLSGFKKIECLAETIEGDPCPEFLKEIRKIGIEMEEGMFSASNHINAHKGALFTLVLTVFAAAYCHKRFNKYDIDEIRSIIISMTDGLTDELKEPKKKALTHGEILYRDHGILGIRGEAEKGYPNVFEKAYPYLVDHHNQPINDLMINTLFMLMSSVDDSNILWRQDINTLNEVKELSCEIIDVGGMFSEKGRDLIKKTDEEFIKMRISPGGSADLLSMSVFLGFVGDIL